MAISPMTLHPAIGDLRQQASLRHIAATTLPERLRPSRARRRSPNAPFDVLVKLPSAAGNEPRTLPMRRRASKMIRITNEGEGGADGIGIFNQKAMAIMLPLRQRENLTQKNPQAKEFANRSRRFEHPKDDAITTSEAILIPRQPLRLDYLIGLLVEPLKARYISSLEVETKKTLIDFADQVSLEEGILWRPNDLVLVHGRGIVFAGYCWVHNEM
ncbi:hypothetical protein K469DRAFT_686882 [Zopfia rhizophila CBS 207.26]|uniref:Uncharacterized protein n=1 Tax=Zopfia rhizophila CBS 207.26 TaxID=1314779 RepID=A0A6A6E8J1_9PEZI|nr:hypothetical protein K469DRAFT_686882 [Zopfia rhizophila CBS 207.26]